MAPASDPVQLGYRSAALWQRKNPVWDCTEQQATDFDPLFLQPVNGKRQRINCDGGTIIS